MISRDIRVEIFEGRFKNWVRWCRASHIHNGRCGSAEGGWRSPQVWESPGPRPGELDDLDAVKLERVFTSELVRDFYRRAIKLWYFKRWRAEWVARKLRIRPDDIPLVLEQAKLNFFDAVDFCENGTKLAEVSDGGKHRERPVGAAFAFRDTNVHLRVVVEQA